MTTTIELIEKLDTQANSRAGYENDIFWKSAQRLRELDKPDCFWLIMPLGRDANGKESYAYAPQCLPIDGLDFLPMTKNKFCQYCGGAVKEST